jgi:2'-5' RNA ligase
LFVALVPPESARVELATALRALPSPARLRWTSPEQWHVTLAFLAEVDERTQGQLVDRLGRVAGRHPPPELALVGGGQFGHRVLWTRVDGDRVVLRRLVDAVRAAVRRCGLPAERRPFRPHLTLARGGGAGGPDLVPLVGPLRHFVGRPWLATQLHLVCSHLGEGPGGTARHEPVAAWALTGRRQQGPGSTARTHAQNRGALVVTRPDEQGPPGRLPDGPC